MKFYIFGGIFIAVILVGTYLYQENQKATVEAQPTTAQPQQYQPRPEDPNKYKVPSDNDFRNLKIN